MSQWLSRYLAGQHRQVWTEITGLGPQVRAPEHAADAEAVGRETMQRARRNVERLVIGLPEIGWRFSPGDGLSTFLPPPADVRHRLDTIEANVGAIPLSARWWLEEVGTVNLMGGHPDWFTDASDPLVVEMPVEYIENEIEAWEHDRGTEWERPFALDFSPDALHKANVSGGPPYSLAVPNASADGLVVWERHQTTFVNMIRMAFQAGGFLGPVGLGHTDETAPRPLIDLASTLEEL